MKSGVLAVLLGVTLLAPALSSAEGVFGDVRADHPYREAIEDLWSRGIARGFPQPGSYPAFWPDQAITRAEFLSMVIRSLYPQTEIDGCAGDLALLRRQGLGPVFPDVPGDSWFAPFVCTAWMERLIGGYADGSFRPHTRLSFAEAAKILTLGFDLVHVALPDIQTAQEKWYDPYVRALTDAEAVPMTIRYFDHTLTRAESAEMLDRLVLFNEELGINPARVNVSYEEVRYPVDWTEFIDYPHDYAVAYPSIWSEPKLSPRYRFENRMPYLPSLWKVYFGPMRTCSGFSTCIERDFSVDGYDPDLEDQASAELAEAPGVTVLSDETRGSVRTIVFDEELRNCPQILRSALVLAPKRFLRISQNCGSDLDDPREAFLHILGRFRLLPERS